MYEYNEYVRLDQDVLKTSSSRPMFAGNLSLFLEALICGTNTNTNANINTNANKKFLLLLC